MAYKAPIWEDGKSPAISAENLNNLSQAVEGAQVLYGNSAPTSSTEGAVGQFYLVVVADGYGNYPLYQCVAIANGSYVWRDTSRIPDSITSMLGIPAPGTINSALNVLANIGNVHVWSRTITLTDSTYKPVVGEDNYSATLNPGDKLYYSDSVDIASLQDINLASPVSTFSFDGYSVPSVVGKYIRKNDGPTIYIYPASDQSIAGSTLWLRNCHEISAAVDTPAGTHTDFVTSTDSTAYPRDGDVGDCHYTYLGQLGGGARIEVGSYVGTGTCGKENLMSLNVGKNCVKVEIRGRYSASRVSSSYLEIFPQIATSKWSDQAYYANGTMDQNSFMKIVDGVLYWYSKSADSQGNFSGYEYKYTIYKK